MKVAPPPQRARASWRQVVGLIMALATAAYGFHWYRFRHNFYDLRIYIDAMRWWDAGHPLYDFVKPDDTQGQLGYTYPPFAGVLMRPLAWLPSDVVINSYIVGSVLLLALCLWLLVRPLADRQGWPRWWTLALALVLAAGLEPVRETFMFGQVNVLLWALVLVDLMVLAPRASRFTGVGIGLATAIKLVPGIFIVYLLITRRWLAAAVASATAAIATAVAAVIAPGDSWTYWTEKVLLGEGVGQLAYEFNQSIMGVLARLAQPDPPSRSLWVLLVLPIVGLGLWRASRAASAGDEVTGLTLTGLVGSLISPVTWVHHIFWFVPALVVLIDSLARPNGVSRQARAGLAAFAVTLYATVTVSLISLWAYQLGRPGGFLGFVLTNWFVWLMLALLVVLPIRSAHQRSPGMS